MTARTYATPAAFKKALEHRLKTSSSSSADLNRRRQLLVFDRFLARLAKTLGDAVVTRDGKVPVKPETLDVLVHEAYAAARDQIIRP